MIYLDGNSLGVLPRATAARVQQVVQQEWGNDLIRSWNSAGWIDLPQRIGDKIARLVGAGPGELVVADSTSVNLFKVLSAALAIAQADAPERRVILSERSNFPTDLYIAEALARERGCELVLVDEPDEIAGAGWTSRVAVLMLTHVNYRSGRMHDMAALTRAAHDAGALAVWDLAHSAGAVPVDLQRRRRRLRGRLRLQVPQRRPRRAGLRLGRTRAMPSASGSRWRAGWAMPRRSSSRPTTGPPPASRATCAARRRCCRWRRWNAASTPCWPPSRWAAWRRCARKSLALTELFIALVDSALRRPRPGAGLAARGSPQRGSQVCLVAPRGRLRRWCRR